MKSVIYWSAALPSLMLGAPALAVQGAPAYEPYGAEYSPSAPYEQAAYNWDDRVYSEQGDQRGVYDGTWTGNYVDNEGRVYQGEWNGTYVDENGQAYRGTYRGTSVGDPRYGTTPNTAGVQAAPFADDYYDPNQARGNQYAPSNGYVPGPGVRSTYSGQQYERPSRGIAGAAIGGVAGGVAGNVIAGRGNRLAGTLIGGGLGAVAGAAIQRSADRRRLDNRQYVDQRGPQYAAGGAAPYQGQRYQQAGGYGTPTSYGWQGQSYAYGGAPAYYVQPQAYTGGTTTVVIVPGQTVSTTTTTVTEESYQAAPEHHTYASKRLLRRR